MTVRFRGGGHKRLYRKIDFKRRKFGVPATVDAAGIGVAAYRAALPDLVRDAFRDASLRTNPRMPLLEELGALFGQAA